MINLDAYREQLNRSIAQATGQTYMPTDTSDQGSTSQDNLGAVDNPDDSGGMATDHQPHLRFPKISAHHKQILRKLSNNLSNRMHLRILI